LGSGAVFDLVGVVWWVGWLAVGLTVALALQVLVMRERIVRRERRRERVFATWRPVLFERLLGGAPALPPLPVGDEEDLLLLWNQLQDGVRGEARGRLNALAEAVGAPAAARRLLARGTALGRLLAIRTLGQLGRAGDYDDVVRYLDERASYLCLAAARALVHIDPRRAPDDVLRRLPERPDWPVSLFATALSEANPERLAAQLRALQGRLPAAELARLLPLTSLLPEQIADGFLGDLLSTSAHPEALCAALRAVRGPALRDQVRRACAHPVWAVRTQAAAALGRIGEPEDLGPLLALLRDPQWWVRYRAAQALTSGRFGSAAEIVALADRLQDRFARDIVAHALAEVRA
jgi:HEAT repeat protein